MTATHISTMTTNAENPRIPWKLYLFVFFSYVGDRSWTFAIGLFMVQLSAREFEWPAIYGLVVSLVVVVFSPGLGRMVDRNQRWRAVRIALITQNVFVALCSLCVALTFYFRHILEMEGEYYWGHPIACSIIIFLGSIAQCGTVSTTLTVHKDWVVVIANGNQEQLAKINSVIRFIDWVTKVVGPIVMGNMFFNLRQEIVAGVVGCWNLVSFFIELVILWSLYKDYPKLAIKVTPNQKEHVSNDDPENDASETKMPESTENPTEKDRSLCHRFVRGFMDVKSWSIYYQHRVRNAGISLSWLYLTVFGFDSIMTSFSYTQGTPEFMMGVFSAISVLIGVLAFFLFPFLVRRLGIVHTGLFGFTWEVICLILCVGSIWAPGSPFDPSVPIYSRIEDPFVRPHQLDPNITEYVEFDRTAPNGDRTSITILRAGICSARLGLWLADLSVNQILQGVDDNVRGTINGVQSSLNMCFNVVKFGLVIILSQPETWGILVWISFCATSCGWLFYASYAYQRHRHSKRRKSLAPSPTIQPPRDDSPGDMNDRGPDSTLRERHPVRTQVHQLKEKIDSLSVSTDSAGGASPQLTVNRGRISTVLPDNYAWVYGTDGQEIPGTPGSSGYQSSNENSSCASNDNSPSNVHRRVFFSEDTFQVPPTNAQNTKRRGKKEPEFFVVQV